MVKKIMYSSDPWFPSRKNTFTLFAAITHACNQKCLHCFASEDVLPKNLEDKWWYALFDQLAEVEASRLFFTGGEPLIHPSFFEYATYATKKSIPVILGTNATLITPVLSKNLVDAGISEARVSLDGANEISHDCLRGEGSFEKTLNGIRLMIEAGIAVSIRTTVNKLNFKELQKIAELIVGLGVSDWEIKHIIPAGNAKKHPELLTSSMERTVALDTILNMIKVNTFPDLKIKLMEGTINQDTIIPESIKVASCPAGTRMMVVQPTGDVIPCGYLTSSVLGNITQESLKTIREKWEEEKKKGEKFLVPEGCKKCKHVQICKGGCPAFNFCNEDVGV